MVKISDMILLDLPDQPVLAITTHACLPEMADKVSQCFGKLRSYLKSINGFTADVPYVAYHNWRDMYDKQITISVGVPTSKLLPGTEEIESFTIPAQRNVSCLFRGSYGEMHSFYDLMEKWVDDRGMKVSGDCYEFYYNGAEFAEEDYLTKVIFPIKAL